MYVPTRRNKRCTNTLFSQEPNSLAISKPPQKKGREGGSKNKTSAAPRESAMDLKQDDPCPI